jgi:hypothetical protein
MNDPQVLEAARVLAQNTANLNLTNEQKLKRVFQLILCRNPSNKEMEMLQNYFVQEKNKFNQNKIKASSFIKAGEYAQIKTKDLGETAALMQVNQLLFNLDETTVK